MAYLQHVHHIFKQLPIMLLEACVNCSQAGGLQLQQQLSHKTSHTQAPNEGPASVTVPDVTASVAQTVHPSQLRNDVTLQGRQHHTQWSAAPLLC
jgi:hypothetical protein